MNEEDLNSCFRSEVVAPNGAVYLVNNLSLSEAALILTDNDSYEYVLYAAFRQNVQPIKGLPYYDSSWEAKFSERYKMFEMNMGQEPSCQVIESPLKSPPVKRNKTDSVVQRDTASTSTKSSKCLFNQAHNMNPEQDDELASPLPETQSKSHVPKIVVFVTQLPENFEEKILLSDLNRRLWKENFCPISERPASSIIDKGQFEASVEFTSAEAASKICSLSNVEYEGEIIKVNQLKENPVDPTLTNRVSISCLPPDFDNSILLSDLNRSLWWDKFCLRSVRPACRVVERDESETIVEFTSVDAAKRICSLKVKYEGEDIKLTHLKKSPVVEPILTNRVLVSLLPDDFEDTILLSDLNRVLWEVQFCFKPERPAIRVLKRAGTVATVEFTSVEAAKKICSSNFVQYENELIILEQQTCEEELGQGVSSPSSTKDEFNLSSPAASSTMRDACAPSTSESNISNFQELNVGNDEYTEEEYAKFNAEKNSHFVAFGNVSRDFKEHDFKTLLCRKMESAGFIRKDEDPIEQLFQYNPTSKTVVVKFTCSEEANLAVLLQDVEYEGSKLAFKKHVDDENQNVGDGDCLIVDDETIDNLMSIDDEKCFEKVLWILATFRDDFPKNQCQDGILTQLIPVLANKGIRATLPEFRRRKRLLREAFGRRKKEGKHGGIFYKLGSVAFDNGDPSILRGTDYELLDKNEFVEDDDSDGEKRLRELILYSECSSWTNNSTLALVKVVEDNKEEFLKPGRSIKFWRKISTQLYEKQYVYGAEKCSSKYSELFKHYKNFHQEAERTGAPNPTELLPEGTTKEIMEVIHRMEHNNVTVKPRVLMAAGSKSVMKVVKEEDLDTSKSTGRTRIPILKRDTSLQAEKLKIALIKANALKTIASKMPDQSGGK